MSRLRGAGLQYHDILLETEIMQKTVERLSPEEQLERQRRIRRALDLSLKHEEIPHDKWENPWRTYGATKQVLEETQMLEDEKKHLAGKFW